MGQRITEGADGLNIIAVRGRALSHGYYVARRRTWGPDKSWHIVFVFLLEDETGTKRGVFQAGSTEPDHPKHWIFRSRILGLEDLPAFLPPHPRVQLAELVH
ncbi:hypothetical protein Q8W71_06815 [Methylobacterium sp. NEAU 140]|uniref:hypothetical protein n=1 Tax=Methylobacterium sp. NEAU 140 TaxID=3064945 RepID=UPI0027375C6A|nr:hypothetical protein [Methylobacterium sp. NEAU 140]MDP4022328.1 hypothetical protein [Methylobacterium sp. NEAU 140]